MTKPRPLSVAQGLILNTAGHRADRMVLPFPAGLPARGANLQRLVASLLKRGLIEEVTTALPTLSWRQDGQGGLHALLITTAGLAAVGIDADLPLAPAPHAGPVPVADVETSIPDASAAMPAVRPAGKLGRVMDAAQAEQGATLAELVALTGWLPHTTRAALTRLRQRGFAFELKDIAGRKAYRLNAGADA